MTDYQFWCPKCKKGYHEHELERREIDTMFGDGRWWWCRTCGSEVRFYSDVVKDQTMKNHWDPQALAEEMRKSTKLVSAFFLIDSLESISRCIEWLALIKPYGMPDMEYSQYFLNIREIYQVGRQVRNYDQEFKITRGGEALQAFLRCLFFDQGKYEIELLIPGVVAHDLASHFKDGHEGFCCAFLPPLFYD